MCLNEQHHTSQVPNDCTKLH